MKVGRGLQASAPKRKEALRMKVSSAVNFRPVCGGYYMMDPMTPREYRTIVARLDLSREDVARLSGYTPRMLANFKNGDWPVPKILAIALRLIDRHVPKSKLRTLIDH
jgi:hypothetical protein